MASARSSPLFLPQYSLYYQAQMQAQERPAPGSLIKVFWHGDENWYNGTILGHRAIFADDGTLEWLTRVEYASGEYDHNLADIEYEVVRRVEVDQQMSTAEAFRSDAPRCSPLAVRRSTKSPRADAAGGSKRGHLALRRKYPSTLRPALRTVEVNAMAQTALPHGKGMDGGRHLLQEVGCESDMNPSLRI